MKRNAEEPAALEKRAQPGRLRAVFLAIVVHALFFGLIIFGVTWQSSPSPPVQAELWDKLPPAPAKPVPAKPEPPKAEPPKPEPPKPAPPKPDVKPDPPKPDPEIALKVEREKRERDKREKEKRERLEKQKQDEVKKKREQDEAAKKKRDEEIARLEAEKAREAAASARQKEFDRFVNAIRAKIRGRANVPDTVTGKPNVQVQIRILPGGDVLDIRILKPSGNRVYDTAIERAIRSAQPLPVPAVDSELFPQFRDLILNIEHER